MIHICMFRQNVFKSDLPTKYAISLTGLQNMVYPFHSNRLMIIYDNFPQKNDQPRQLVIKKSKKTWLISQTISH